MQFVANFPSMKYVLLHYLLIKYVWCIDALSNGCFPMIGVLIKNVIINLAEQKPLNSM